MYPTAIISSGWARHDNGAQHSWNREKLLLQIFKLVNMNWGELFHHDDVMVWKFFPHWLPLLKRVYRLPMDSPHKDQKCFHRFLSRIAPEKYIENEMIYGLTWITSLWSLLTWFVDDFYSWLCHSWKSLANHPTCDKALFTTNHIFYIFIEVLSNALSVMKVILLACR